MQHLKLEEIVKQANILQRNYRVNFRSMVNRDIICYVMHNSETLGSIEILYSPEIKVYIVDWAKADGKLQGKGKLLYYLALNEAWPKFVGPGPRTNGDAFRIWKAMETTEGLESKTIDGKLYFRLKNKF